MAKRSLAGMMALAPKTETEVESHFAPIEEAPALLEPVDEQAPVDKPQLEVGNKSSSQPLSSELPTEPTVLPVSRESIAAATEGADDLQPAAAPAETEDAPSKVGVSDLAATTEDASPVSAPRVSRTAPKAKRAAGGAMYARLEAKEARLRPDQRDELGVLARRLERARQQARREHATERITDNTLIRVAIDVLLEAGVEGLTESELRESLRSKVSV